MSALSPASVSAEPSGIVSPPSTSVTPVPPPAKPTDDSDEKIAYEKPVAEEGIEAVRPVNADDNLPEVVPEGHVFSSNNNTSSPGMQYPVDSKSAMRSADEAQGIVPPEQMQTPPPAFQQQPPVYTNSMAPPPINQSTTNFPTDDQTVTPLHLLGDQSDTIDCPFCRRRSMTQVKLTGSWLTHIWAVILFFFTFFGAVAPYYFHWNSNVAHWCNNCNRKVAYRNFGSSKMNPLGTPDHLREASKFQAVETPTGMNPNAAQQV